MHEFSSILKKLVSATKAGYKTYSILYSKTATLFLARLYYEGFINGFSIITISEKKYLKIYLKYNYLGNPPFQKIKTFFSRTTPIYLGLRELSKLEQTLNVFLLSTPQGILSHQDCLKKNIGGVLICSIL